MYIPIIKNRSVEMKAFEEMSYCFSQEIIPLFEVISDTYEIRYQTDPETHKAITTIKPGNTRPSKVKLPNTDENKNTYKRILKIMQNKSAFIDIFRYDARKYGNSKINIEECLLATQVSRNTELYKEKLLEICNYDNLIPVISIKPNFEFLPNELVDL